MVQALLEEVERFEEQTPALKPHLEKKTNALPVLN
jgi:(E)-4-hydroxy-3-methylbut-2-enyl-diphosphate synthase